MRTTAIIWKNLSFIVFHGVFFKNMRFHEVFLSGFFCIKMDFSSLYVKWVCAENITIRKTKNGSYILSVISFSSLTFYNLLMVISIVAWNHRLCLNQRICEKMRNNRRDNFWMTIKTSKAYYLWSFYVHLEFFLMIGCIVT